MKKRNRSRLTRSGELIFGPIKMKPDLQRDPSLRHRSVRQSTESALRLMAAAINRMNASVAAEIGSRDPERVAQAVARLQAKFSRLDHEWSKLRR